MNRKGFLVLLLLTLYASLCFAQPVLDTVCLFDAPTRFAVPFQNEVNYQWSVGQGTIIGNPDSNVVWIDWSLANEGYNRIAVFGQQDGQVCPGDTSQAFVLVIIPNLARASFPDYVCEGDIVMIESGVSGDFIWGGGSQDRTIRFKAKADTSIYLVALNDPCQNDTLIFDIQVLPRPLAEMGPIPDTVYYENLAVLFYPNDTTGLKIEWFVNGSYFSEGQRVELYPTELGDLEILQVVSNDYCSDSVVYWIFVDELFKVFFPTAFTPNGDGLNEIWHFKGVGISSFNALIYNRWGEIIYRWDENSAIQGWDGTAKGQASQPGSYMYKIEITDQVGRIHYFTDFFTLMR